MESANRRQQRWPRVCNRWCGIIFLNRLRLRVSFSSAFLVIWTNPATPTQHPPSSFIFCTWIYISVGCTAFFLCAGLWVSELFSLSSSYMCSFGYAQYLVEEAWSGFLEGFRRQKEAGHWERGTALPHFFDCAATPQVEPWTVSLFLPPHWSTFLIVVVCSSLLLIWTC
jgi:hypothetical protein